MAESCETCTKHDELTNKVSFMQGAGWLFSAVLLVILGIIATAMHSAFGGIDNNRGRVEHNHDEVQQVRALVGETNINLRHLMEAQGLEYQEATR